ncbi:MAG: hypothetical protein AAFY28_17740 [Actinomycetota bacterium]
MTVRNGEVTSAASIVFSVDGVCCSCNRAWGLSDVVDVVSKGIWR